MIILNIYIYIYIYNIYKNLNLVLTWNGKNCLILTKIRTKLKKNRKYIETKLNKNNEYQD